MIVRNPLPLKDSGFVCLLIFKTSKGNSTTSPIPIKDPAVADIKALPVFSPKVSLNEDLKLLFKNSLAKG
ncbi:hypothetical protein WICPIJ_007592 [Wickerhamomyces pijperi]|uniref:Uncharacterized protein n=1 Tax=Wickerhamomyces pijperi TaxID=599730 RepID=A0A9P8Q1G3_WICPI|nr:hypothetical protein WICPIJ_007592 [Wickerhamomyces pijperi]